MTAITADTRPVALNGHEFVGFTGEAVRCPSIDAATDSGGHDISAVLWKSTQWRGWLVRPFESASKGVCMDCGKIVYRVKAV